MINPRNGDITCNNNNNNNSKIEDDFNAVRMSLSHMRMSSPHATSSNINGAAVGSSTSTMADDLNRQI